LNTGGRYNPDTDSWIATSATNATGRAGHTAVWTDHEMIVWGGEDFSGQSSTGGKYNPGTNSWTPTSTTNAPDARSSHSAIWTGSEMIVWGGINFSAGDLNTGGRYDPALDSWTPTSTTNAPDARSSHSAVWTGSEMIVWGGTRGNLLPGDLNTGGRYDPVGDDWTATSLASAPAARDSHTAVWTGSEMIVWGGRIDSDSAGSTGGRYCTQSGATPTPTATPRVTPRSRPTPHRRP
jgi:N-acetylneuraminic acid mutarotase